MFIIRRTTKGLTWITAAWKSVKQKITKNSLQTFFLFFENVHAESTKEDGISVKKKCVESKIENFVSSAATCVWCRNYASVLTFVAYTKPFVTQKKSSELRSGDREGQANGYSSISRETLNHLIFSLMKILH